MSYLLHVVTTAGIFGMLALSLDLLVGWAGMMSLASGVFFGVGAYTTALMVKGGVPPLMAMALGMACATVLSLVVALPAIRVRGIYLLIVTIAVQVIFTIVLQNWRSVTGGDAGVTNVPPLSVLGTRVHGTSLTVLVWLSCLAWWWLLHRLVLSPFGQVLQAVRDDEVGAASLGKNVTATKLAAFGLSSAIAAYAGSLYAHYSAYVDPMSFDVGVSIVALLMVMLGGAGTLKGPLLGAVVLTALPEVLKFVPLPAGAAAALRQLSYGALLVLVVFFRPQGLLGRAPSRQAH